MVGLTESLTNTKLCDYSGPDWKPSVGLTCYADLNWYLGELTLRLWIYNQDQMKKVMQIEVSIHGHSYS